MSKTLISLIFAMVFVQSPPAPPDPGGDNIVWSDDASVDNTSDFADDIGSLIFDSGNYSFNSGTNTFARYTPTQHTSSDQWGIMQIDRWGNTSSSIGFMFRNDASEQSNYHVAQQGTGTVFWSSAIAGSEDFDACFDSGWSSAGSPVEDDWFYACIEGTGSSTIVKTWLSASEPAQCTNTCENNCGTWGTPAVSYTNPVDCALVSTGLNTGLTFTSFGGADPRAKNFTLGDIP